MRQMTAAAPSALTYADLLGFRFGGGMAAGLCRPAQPSERRAHANDKDQTKDTHS